MPNSFIRNLSAVDKARGEEMAKEAEGASISEIVGMRDQLLVSPARLNPRDPAHVAATLGLLILNEKIMIAEGGDHKPAFAIGVSDSDHLPEQAELANHLEERAKQDVLDAGEAGDDDKVNLLLRGMQTAQFKNEDAVIKLNAATSHAQAANEKAATRYADEQSVLSAIEINRREAEKRGDFQSANDLRQEYFDTKGEQRSQRRVDEANAARATTDAFLADQQAAEDAARSRIAGQVQEAAAAEK